uniref:Uncharacterized protein n=1 Tax=Zea mays TaxID=4577 RepID=C0HIE8_MAIZE|nr:unknown [Zea mays]
MTTPAAEAVSRRLGAAVRGLSGAWYGRHMASAERAIRARLPLVDLVLEVRDARAPASSSFEPLLRRRGPLEPDRRAVVLLNKADLADPSETEGARAAAGVGGVHQEAEEMLLRRGKLAQQGKHQGGAESRASKNEGDQAWRQQLHGNCPPGRDPKRWEIGHR